MSDEVTDLSKRIGEVVRDWLQTEGLGSAGVIVVRDSEWPDDMANFYAEHLADSASLTMWGQTEGA